MISFLQLKSRSIGTGALLLLAACLVVTFSFTQAPAETRSRSGAGAPPPAAPSHSARDWVPYDLPQTAPPRRDSSLRLTVDRPTAGAANAARRPAVAANRGRAPAPATNAGRAPSAETIADHPLAAEASAEPPLAAETIADHPLAAEASDDHAPVEATYAASSIATESVTAPAVKFMSSALRPITFSLLIAKPGELLKSAIKVMHLLGIILGLGAATVLDLVIVKFLVSGKIKAEQIAMVKFMTGIVSAGLAVLWFSGILYLAHYAMFDPVKLGNQKVWAKIAIVGVLTINGYFIHKTVLPLMEKQIGRSLFAGLSRKQITMMMVFGTVSATSWYVPLILGAMPHFNFIVPAPRLLVAYALILLIAIAATHGMVDTVRRRGGLEPRLQPAI